MHFRWAIAILLAVVLAGCATARWREVPLPRLPAGAVVLRVAHGVNPRFDRLSPEQIDRLLAQTRRTVREHFGVEVRFEPVREISLAALFSRIPPVVLAARRPAVFDFKHGSGDVARFKAGMRAILEASSQPLADMLAYAAPYLLHPVAAPTRAALADALADTQLARLDRLRGLKAADGQPVLDDVPYNEWAYWDSLGYGNPGYDVVLTNQLVASAEYGAADVHSALRGGITLGTTAYSGDGRYGAYLFWSTYPATNPDLAALRGGRNYTPDQAASLAGAALAHEIGHLLFHFGHPFAASACVMNPVPLLNYQEWHEALDASRCRPGSRPEMRPGAVPLHWNPAWTAQR